MKKGAWKRKIQEGVPWLERVSLTVMKTLMFANIAIGLYIFNFSSGFEDQNVYEIISNSMNSFKMAMWQGLPQWILSLLYRLWDGYKK